MNTIVIQWLHLINNSNLYIQNKAILVAIIITLLRNCLQSFIRYSVSLIW